ncbi:MAG: mechanosensitive ion channel family protein [Myxococcota bacterium]
MKGLNFDLGTVVYSNTVEAWLVALGVLLGVLIVLRIIKQVVIVRLARLTVQTSTIADDLLINALKKTKLIYLFIVSVFAGSVFLELPSDVRTILWRTTIIATLIQAGIWLSEALMTWLQHYRERQLEQDAASVMTMNALGIIGRIVLWATVLMLALDNVGVDVTALVAGLGIGGVAVALAIQNILGDLFASLSIVLDKPFVIGDFIAVGDHLGSVENIGIKTTRLRSLSGEQLVFANGDLLSSRIRNFGRMYRRRVVFGIGVVYQTSHEQLERIPSVIQEAIERHAQTTFDRSHFATYGDSSLDFETVYYVESPDYNAYMDIQQAINLELFRRFEELGIEFAYPTRTLFVEHTDAPGTPAGD